MARDALETIKLSYGVTAHLVIDPEPESPANWDNVGSITYREGARYILGTEAVSQERFEEIAAGIEDGSLVGMPVYAYVHSGAAIATTPFHCAWDSGRSGWVYCSRKRAREEWGTNADRLAVVLGGEDAALTEECKASALKCLKGEVETFSDYLEGNVYGFVVEDRNGNQLDSCWGFYGRDYAMEEMRSAAESCVDTIKGERKRKRKAAKVEASERAFWAARGVMTSLEVRV